MRKLLLWICAAAGVGLAVSLSLVSRPSAAEVTVSAATMPAARQTQFEALLTELDPALTEMASQLRGKLMRNRLGVPERCVSWTTRDGTAMTARVWLEDVNGRAKLNTAIEAQCDLAEDQSFYMQYWRLRKQFDDEARNFTLVSEIQKTEANDDTPRKPGTAER